MSTTELAHAEAETEQTPTRTLAVRRLDTTIEAGDGRTVSLLFAPFGQTATSADGLGGVAKGVPYTEELVPGLYDGQLKAANRIWLNFEHQPGLQGIIGHGCEIWQDRDGYHGSFRVHDTPEGDKALMLVREGVLGGASVESYWQKSVRTAAGVVRRVKAHLDAIALCREGAYPGAVVTGLRSGELEPEILVDEALLPVQADRALLERAERLGIRLPDDMLSRHS